MNTLSFPQLVEALEDHDNGLTAIDDIKLIQGWLLPTNGDRLDLEKDPEPARISPSLVTRGDCELFGVAYPRFAYRVYLDQAKSIFLNVRRLPALCHQVSEKYGETWASHPYPRYCEFEQVATHPLKPKDEIKLSSFVADGLIRAPHLAKDYHVLQAELAEEMGELSLEEKKLKDPHAEATLSRGTPFSMGLALGGLCAPNACFMAGALMHKWAKGAFAVGEVAAIVHSKAPEPLMLYKRHGFIPLSEFSATQFGDYFRHPEVGLNSAYQIATNEHNILKSKRSNEADYLRHCIRPYILSGFPVILQVSFSKMDSIYSANQINPKAVSDWGEENEKGDEQDHAIVVVGCGKSKHSHEFIINDPACLCPLLPAGAEGLERASKSTDEHGQHSKPRFFSVTPKAVTVPFEYAADASLAGRDFALSSSGMCLLELVSWVLTKYDDGTYSADEDLLPTPPSKLPCLDDEYRLLTFGDMKALAAADDEKEPRFGLYLPGADPACLQSLVQVLKDLGFDDDQHWFWLHLTIDGESDHAAWLWDAQAKLDYLDASTKPWEKVLIAATSRGKSRSGVLHPVYVSATATDDLRGVSYTEAVPTAEQDITEIDVSRQLEPEDWSKILKPSVITSFSARGIQSAFDEDPWALTPRSCPRFGDLYCFMQGDLETFPELKVSKKGNHNSEPRSVYSYAAEHAENAAVIAKVAERVAKVCQATNNVQLTGIATFLPELNSLWDNFADERKTKLPLTGALMATGALKFILSMCAQLRDKHGHNHLKVVELVAGSQIGGVAPARRKYDKDLENVIFVAQRRNPDSRFQGMFHRESLIAVARHAKNMGIKLAIELEPGPLYAINSFEMLEAFYDDLGRFYPEGLSVVGFNLDIAHWILAGIKPEQVLGSELIRRQIFHAHVSRHTNAHWCDLDFAGSEDYHPVMKRWFSLLGKLAKDYPQSYSGAVALELEANASIDVVRRNLNCLRELIANKTPILGPKTVS